MDDDDLLVTITIEPPEVSFEELTGLAEEQALDIIAHTLAHVGVETPVEVGVMISTDEALRVLNRDFREIDSATDVLSFPFVDEPMVQAPADQLWRAGENTVAPSMNGATDEGGDLDAEQDEDDEEFDDEFEEEDERFVYLGDIAISHETAARQATQAGHPLGWECAFLITHGVLHLVGYDDKTDAGYQAMVANQEAILAELQITK